MAGGMGESPERMLLNNKNIDKKSQFIHEL